MPKTAPTIRFFATLHKPAGLALGDDWTFLKLPQEASDPLPSRGLNSVEGNFGGVPFWATLQPDGNGGHWLRIEQALRESAGVQIGEDVSLEITLMAVEPEPQVPTDLQEALDSAVPKACETWADITTVARRDWIHWIVSGKKAETRTKRIEVALSKMSAGNRRPCCFDRSGMYDKSLSCPAAEEMGDAHTS